MLRIVLENKEALTCKNVESLSCCSLDGRISASGVGARSEILIAIGQYLTVSNGLAINVGTTAVQYGDCACFLYWLKPLTLIFLLNWLCALYTIRMCRLSARCRAVQRQADACISKQKFSVPVPPPPLPTKPSISSSLTISFQSCPGSRKHWFVHRLDTQSMYV